MKMVSRRVDYQAERRREGGGGKGERSGHGSDEDATFMPPVGRLA